METLEIIRKAIKKELGRDFDDITTSTAFEDMAMDSLDVVQMVMAIEEAFDIEIDDDDVEGLKTVGDLVDYIEEKTK